MVKGTPPLPMSKKIPPAATAAVENDKVPFACAPSSTAATQSEEEAEGYALFCRNLCSITMSRLAFDCCRRFHQDHRLQDDDDLPELNKNAGSIKTVIEALDNYTCERTLTNDLCLAMEHVVTCGAGNHHHRITVPGSDPVKAAALAYVEDVSSDKRGVGRNPVGTLCIQFGSSGEGALAETKKGGRALVRNVWPRPQVPRLHDTTCSDRHKSSTRKRHKTSNDSDASHTALDEEPDDASNYFRDSQKFGHWKRPALFFTITFVLGSDKAENEMYLGSFLAQPKAQESDEQFSNVQVALLYRKHVVGSDSIFHACCESTKYVHWFKHQGKVDP